MALAIFHYASYDVGCLAAVANALKVCLPHCLQHVLEVTWCGGLPGDEAMVVVPRKDARSDGIGDAAIQAAPVFDIEVAGGVLGMWSDCVAHDRSEGRLHRELVGDDGLEPPTSSV